MATSQTRRDSFLLDSIPVDGKPAFLTDLEAKGDGMFSIADIQPLTEVQLAAYYAQSSATMTVHNDTQNGVSVNISNDKAMSTNFPNETIGAGQSDTKNIDVSWYDPRQSSFDVSFDNKHTIFTKLGSGQNSTDATPLQFSDSQVAVMLSPKVITPVAVNYDFDYFVGPGVIPPLVNGFIQANLPAILDYVNKHGFEKKSHGFSVKLSNIAMNAADFMCPYAGVNNFSATSADLNVILKLNNKTTVTGTFTTPAGSYSMNGSLTNLAVMLQIHIGINGKKISVEIKKLRLSLADYSFPVEIYILVALLATPAIAALLKAASLNANTLAMAFNTVANSLIVNKLNDIIKDALKPKKPEVALRTIHLGEDYSTWMSDAAIQSKELSALHIPGTHDSGAYALTRTLPDVPYGPKHGIKYPEIAFMWALKRDSAPNSDQWPMPSTLDGSEPVHVGPDLYDFVFDKVAPGTSQAGNQDIQAQLNGGIRWFDLRIYLDKDGHYYMQHGLRGPSFEDIVKQIKSYINAHPNAAELIIMALSHADYGNDRTKGVCDLITANISKDNLLWYANDDGQTTFDFQKLANTKLSALTNGKTKVMFINADQGSDLQYSSPVTNTPGFNWGQGKKLNAFSNTFTPDTPDIVPWVIQLLGGENSKHLEAVAKAQNGKLQEWLKQDDVNRSYNMYSMDWFGESDGSLPVPQILALNHK